MPSASRKSKDHKRKPSVDKAFLELGRQHLAEGFFSESHLPMMPPGRCIKTFGRATNKGRRLSSGSHHVVLTLLQDLQWLPPARWICKTLQPEGRKPDPPNLLKSAKKTKKSCILLVRFFPVFPLCIDEGVLAECTPADRAQPIPSGGFFALCRGMAR